MGSSNGSTTRQSLLVAAGLVGLAALEWLFVWWWSRIPQMGADEQVSMSVDALFTAVTDRDEKQLADCGRRLLAFKDAGKLPLEASTYLNNVISKARAGGWESAAQSLYDFMRLQRRDVKREHSNNRSRSNSSKN